MQSPATPSMPPQPPRRQPRIAIVGGSITGPVGALLLHQAGFHNVVIYEAASDARSQGGGVIGLDHPALHILEELGIGHHEVVRHPSETIWHVDPSGRHRLTYPGRLTTWTVLHQALTARLPDDMLHVGTRVTGISAGDGRPLLRLADGSASPADLVIFADGRSSIGRARLDPGRRTHYAGYVAHRGHAPTHDPISDFWRFEPRPGMQYALAPTPDGLDWTLYLNASPADFTAWFGAPPSERPYVFGRHVSARARDVVDQHAARQLPTGQAALVHATVDRAAVAIADTDPPTRAVWPIAGGHAVLVGDALAPVRPHTVRGANNGIEQAFGLSVALGQHLRHGADLHHALRAWQHRHLPAAIAAVHHGPVLGQRLGLGAPPAVPDDPR